MLSVNWSDGAIRPTPVLFGSRTVFFTSTPVIPSANAMPSIPPPTKTASTSDGVEVVTTGAAIPIPTHPEFHLRLFSLIGNELKYLPDSPIGLHRNTFYRASGLSIDRHEMEIRHGVVQAVSHPNVAEFQSRCRLVFDSV